MLRFKQFLIEAPSIEQQLSAIRDYENEIKRQITSGQLSNSESAPSIVAKFNIPRKGNTEDSFVRTIFDTSRLGRGAAFNHQTVSNIIYGLKDPKNIKISDLMPMIGKLRHELAHAYQSGVQGNDMNTIFTQKFLGPALPSGKAFGNVDWDMKERFPKFDPKDSAPLDPNPSDFVKQNFIGYGSRPTTLIFPEYSYTDTEVNARTVSGAMGAQDWYKDQLERGMQDIDTNDAKAVQDLKNKLRSTAMMLGMEKEQKYKDANIAWGKYTDNILGKSNTPSRAEQNITDVANAAERKMKEKIARGLAQVENEFEIPSRTNSGKGVIAKGADVIGKVGNLMDPISTAVETAAAKISPTVGSVASMYGLTDAIFGKEANSPTTMMEPEKQEQEEKDELLSAAMNPSNNPVPQIAPPELKRSEWRRNNTFK